MDVAHRCHQRGIWLPAPQISLWIDHGWLQSIGWDKQLGNTGVTTVVGVLGSRQGKVPGSSYTGFTVESTMAIR